MSGPRYTCGVDGCEFSVAHRPFHAEDVAARAAAPPVEDDGDPIHDQMPSDRHRNCKHPDCAARAAAPPVVEESELDDHPELLASDAYYASPDPVAGLLREAAQSGWWRLNVSRRLPLAATVKSRGGRVSRVT